VTVAAISLLGVPAAVEPEEGLVYTRADVVVAVAGEVTSRRAYSKRIALPSDECQEGAFTCVEDRIYGQVYALSFVEETFSRQPDGAAVTKLDRGRLLVALTLTQDAEDHLEEALDRRLEELTVAAYALPQAGMGYLLEPFTQQTLLQSTSPVWVCQELDNVYGFDLAVGDVNASSSYSRAGEVADRACRAIGATIEGAAPEVNQTMPDIRSQIRHEIRLATVSTLAGLTWADRLAPLPTGVTFEKTQLDGKKTGAIRDYRDGAFVGHEGRYGEAERKVRLPPTALNVVEAPMWVARWSFEVTRETFGDEPGTDRDPPTSIVMAVVPVSDPLMDELDRSRTPLAVPDQRLVEQALASFKRSGVLGPRVIVEAFANPTIWPSRGEWLVVSCRDDGSARYGVAPFAGAADVTNPREACAAVRQEIGE